jgi:hypothetical protein
VAPLTLSNGSLAVALGNALTVDGSDNLAVVEGDISHDNLAGVSSSDHHARYTDSEARSAVDGSSVSVDHDNLTGVSANGHHPRYSDSEARTAVDGANVDIAGDANTVDGKHAADLEIGAFGWVETADSGVSDTIPGTSSGPFTLNLSDSANDMYRVTVEMDDNGSSGNLYV